MVLPKAIREAAGLAAGMPLSIRVSEGVIEIVPAPRSVRRVRRGRFNVAVPVEPGPTLTERQVQRTRVLVRRGK